MKKVSLWLVVLLICVSMIASFSLIGCKEETVKETKQEEAAEEVSATEKEAAEVDPKLAPYLEANIDWRQFEGATLNVAAISYLDTDLMAEQSLLFEDLTGIKVNFEMLPEQELHQKTMVDLTSGTGQYDMILMDYMLIPQFTSSSDMLAPIDGYLEDPELTDPDWYDYGDVMEHLKNSASFNGKTYGVATLTETSLLYYRKDLFEEKNLEVVNTLDDLMNAAKVLNNPPEINGIGLRGQRGNGMNVYIWTCFFKAFGGDFFKDFPTDMTPTVNTPEAISSIEYYTEILDKYGPSGVTNWTWAETLGGLQQGKIAMCIDSSDFASVINDPDQSTTAGKWGIAMVPEGPNGRWPSFFTFTLSINGSSKQKEAAWLLVQFLTSKQAMGERSVQTWYNSRWSNWEDPEMKEAMSDIEGLYDLMDQSLRIVNADYRPRFEKWAEFGDIIGISLESVIAGSQSATDAMNEAQIEVEKILK
jgi:multiple sugar transport system substrate-binding protein